MEEIGLHSLRPAKGATKNRKRVGRGPGSGNGKTSGRGQKGQKSRSGSHNVRAGFEGGQMPLYMRVGKLRGGHHKMSMPIGPFRTYSQPINVEQLSVFEKGTEVTPELLKERGILRNLRHPVKVLGRGDLSVALTVSADGFSKSAREKIEAAGGTVVELGARETEAPAKRAKKASAPADEAPAVEQAPAAEAAPVEDAPAPADEAAADDADA